MTLLGSTSFAERSVRLGRRARLTGDTISVIPVAFLVGVGQDRLARAVSPTSWSAWVGRSRRPMT